MSTAVIIDGRHYCEKHAEGSRCWKSGLPFAVGVELPDGRWFSRESYRQGVFDPAQAQRGYRLAAADLQRVTGLRMTDLPPMSLVGLDEIRRRRDYEPGDTMIERGMYARRQTTTRRVDRRGRVLDQQISNESEILLLYGLDRQEVLVTAVHELTHHLLAEHFPRFAAFAPLWAEEGICQYLAAIVAQRRGYTRLVEQIENSPDPVYGDGYRYFRRLYGRNNWPAIRAWLDDFDHAHGLPGQAP